MRSQVSGHRFISYPNVTTNYFQWVISSLQTIH